MNQKGCTFMEVLLSMALFAIVSLCVIFFLNMGTKTGRTAQEQIDLQTQSQVVLNQLSTFTMEGNDTAVLETSDAFVYKIFQNDKVTKQTKTETILLYRKAEQKLYYYEVKAGMSTAEIEKVKEEITDSSKKISAGELMGENIAAFTADCSERSMVSFTLTIAIHGDKFTADSSVKYRSKRVASVTPIV